MCLLASEIAARESSASTTVTVSRKRSVDNMTQADPRSRASTGRDEANEMNSAKILKLLSATEESNTRCTAKCGENTSSSPTSDLVIAHTEESTSKHPVLTPDQCGDDISPDEYLKAIVLANVGLTPVNKPALSLPHELFPKPTPEQLSSFTTELMLLVRDNQG